MAFSAVAADPSELTGSRLPVTLDRDGAEPALLALHGFTGTPFEVELLLDAATELGLRGLAPLLPGHGTGVLQLSRVSYADWLACAEAALFRLERPALVAGLSMGTLLSLELALRHPERVRGLILMANALRLTYPFPTLALKAVDRLRLPNFFARKGLADIGDVEAQRSHVSYRKNPVHSAIEVLRAGERLQQRLAAVRCPTLILHGARDRVCPVSNAWLLAERLGTSDSRVVVFPRSHHILTRDVERAAVQREVVGFLRRFQGAQSSI